MVNKASLNVFTKFNSIQHSEISKNLPKVEKSIQIDKISNNNIINPNFINILEIVPPEKIRETTTSSGLKLLAQFRRVLATLKTPGFFRQGFILSKNTPFSEFSKQITQNRGMFEVWAYTKEGADEVLAFSKQAIEASKNNPQIKNYLINLQRNLAHLKQTNQLLNFDEVYKNIENAYKFAQHAFRTGKNSFALSENGLYFGQKYTIAGKELLLLNIRQNGKTYSLLVREGVKDLKHLRLNLLTNKNNLPIFILPSLPQQQNKNSDLNDKDLNSTSNFLANYKIQFYAQTFIQEYLEIFIKNFEEKMFEERKRLHDLAGVDKIMLGFDTVAANAAINSPEPVTKAMGLSWGLGRMGRLIYDETINKNNIENKQKDIYENNLQRIELGCADQALKISKKFSKYIGKTDTICSAEEKLAAQNFIAQYFNLLASNYVLGRYEEFQLEALKY